MKMNYNWAMIGTIILPISLYNWLTTWGMW